MKKERKTVQSPKVFKSCLPDLSEIPMDEVTKIKMSLDSLDPEKLIQEALQSSSDYQAYRNIKTKKDDLLEQTKTKAISNFITDLKNKSEQQMRNAFSKRINEYNTGYRINSNILHAIFNNDYNLSEGWE